MRKLHNGKKGVWPQPAAVGRGELSAGLLEAGRPDGWLGEQIWLPLVGPRLEVGALIRKLSVWGHL